MTRSESIDLNTIITPLRLSLLRETDRPFTASGVHLVEHDRDHQFHFRHATFSSQLKSRVDLALAKTAALRIMLNLDGVPITSKSHSPITLTNFSSINVVFIFRFSSSPRNPVTVSER
jgi:hypothetical protein